MNTPWHCVRWRAYRAVSIIAKCLAMHRCFTPQPVRPRWLSFNSPTAVPLSKSKIRPAIMSTCEKCRSAIKYVPAVCPAYHNHQSILHGLSMAIAFRWVFFFPIFFSSHEHRLMPTCAVWFDLQATNGGFGALPSVNQQPMALGSNDIALTTTSTTVMTPVVSSEPQATWSELTVEIDQHVLRPKSRKIIILCETNIYTVYRGSAEAQLVISDESSLLVAGGKVSPTIDQRSNTSRGDPDNSALLGDAVSAYACNFRYLLLRQAMPWLLLLLVYL